MKEKVAILGGGIGSLTTAFELAQQKNEQGESKYDITVYQLGWRLGGKLATGRNQERGQRIEEHGIHGFLGAYYNAGELMGKVFKHLSSIKGLSGFYTKFDDAFLKQNTVIMWKNEEAQWDPWKITIPPNDKSYDDVHIVSDYRERIVSIIKIFADQMLESNNYIAKFLGRRLLSELEKRALDFDRLGDWIVNVLARIWHFVRPFLQLYLYLFRSSKVRQLFIVADFNFALLVGFFNDDIRQKGFASIDHQNYAGWLKKHGAANLTIESSFAKNTPDITYNFKGGDTTKEAEMAAGSFLQWSLRLYGFIGSFVMAFKAGSGESVLAPIYRSLKEEGVKFEFFNKVTNLNVCTKQKIIQSVDIDIQATVKGKIEYQPLIGPVANLMCWPSQPIFMQLEEGSELKAQDINLESWWSPWKNVGKKTLRAGEDYDHLVLGISIGAHQFVCKELVKDKSNKPLVSGSAYHSRWEAMVEEIETVQTQAMQLWFEDAMPVYLNKSLKLPPNDKWVSGTFAAPVQGHVDFSDLIPAEEWPKDGPKGIFYICGPQKDTGFPSFSDVGFPKSQNDMAKKVSIEYLNTYSGPVLPGATLKNGFDFSRLYDPSGATDEKAFDYQYWRSNIDPSERYVTVLPGASQYRLHAWESGYSNLSLSGDWTNTGLNVGSVEGTVMGGRLAAYAISSSPALDLIYGFDPFGLLESS